MAVADREIAAYRPGRYLHPLSLLDSPAHWRYEWRFGRPPAGGGTSAGLPAGTGFPGARPAASAAASGTCPARGTDPVVAFELSRHAGAAPFAIPFQLGGDIVNRKKNVHAAVVGAALIAFAGSAAAAGAELRFAKAPIQGQYIVVLKDDAASLASENNTRKPQVATIARDIAHAHRAELRASFNHALRGFVVRASDESLARILADNRVAYVEEDGEVRAFATQSNATWGIDRTDQRDLPLSGTYTYDTTASSVNAYIIDTGIRASHNDFGGRVSGGYTAISDGRGTSDCNGHGTHVAGTVGGATWGIAKAVKLVPIRVLDCNGSGTTSGVIAGVDWVTSNHVKPAVANMSLGGGASSSLDTAVNNSINAGVVYAVAAGNDNKDACNYSPARVGAALTAASSTSTDARSSFSNWGSCIDLFAPGSSITSAWHDSDTSTKTISGTSMASPHIAGVAALYLAANPGASPTQVNDAIITASTKDKISDVQGSPNRLLYSFFDGGGGGGDGSTELSNGVTVSGLSGAKGSERHFHINVPSDASKLTVTITGGSGDADLYVKYGSKPTLSSYDCRPYKNGNEESCSFTSPASGTWYVMLHGYSSYSDVSLTATYTTSTDPCTGCTKYSGSLSGSGDYDIQPDGTYYYSAAGTHEGWLKGPSNADFDLELYRWDGSKWVRVARSISSTSEEYIKYNGTTGYYYWKILSYSGSGSYDFWLKRP
jgi:serine protease